MDLKEHFKQRAHDSMFAYIEENENNLNPDSETDYEVWSEEFSNSSIEWWYCHLSELNYTNFNELLRINALFAEDYGVTTQAENINGLLRNYGFYWTRFYQDEFMDNWKAMLQ